MQNRLINETSPYLLQHAHNPVDWYPWGETALKRAKEEDKPIFLSIGYSACHWCHVMERESFENEAIAKQMNDGFVCVKVDREERPELDSIYMQAIQTLMGQGGWPLTAFLTPTGKPFYGGTYFPPEDRGGRPGLPRILTAVAGAFRNRKAEVQQAADQLAQSIQDATSVRYSDSPLNEETLESAYHAIALSDDAQHGGFGNAPKFPQSMPQEFLLRYHQRTGEPHALGMVKHSLEAMAKGGIYDHLGGGFARYSTDDTWLVPHFEKMLYDNALLAEIYLQAYQTTGNPAHRTIVEETLEYLLRDMRQEGGGFSSSQDADSEGVEGKYYLWRPEEISAALGSQDTKVFTAYFGVTPEGQLDGANILHVPRLAQEVAAALEIPLDDLLSVVGKAKATLLDLRSKRVPVATDTKLLTAWNALALRSLSHAASVLQNDAYRSAAVANGTFLLANLRQEGRLLRTWKDGHAHLKGYLEDYALLILALLALHEATFSHSWLHHAKALTDEMLTLFWSAAEGTLYDTGIDHEQLVVRPRDIFDNAIPSGSSAAAEALLRMAILTGDNTYREKAHQLLGSVADYLAKVPLGFGGWLCALDYSLAPPLELAILGAPGDDATRALLEVAYAAPQRPHILVGLRPDEENPFPTPLLEGRSFLNGKSAAYVCHNYLCELPTSDPDTLQTQLLLPG